MIYHKEKQAELSHEDDLQKELSRITKILAERNDRGDALLLGLEPFSFIYRFLKRFDMRYGGKTGRALFVLSGGNSDDEQILMEESSHFCELLKTQLRRSDIILQSKPNQFFLLLPELSEVDGIRVIERILSVWNESEHAAGIHIDYTIQYDVYETPRYHTKESDTQSEDPS